MEKSQNRGLNIGNWPHCLLSGHQILCNTGAMDFFYYFFTNHTFTLGLLVISITFSLIE